MKSTDNNLTDNDLAKKLKWLTFYRIIFCILLLGSTIAIQLNNLPSPIAKPLLLLYFLIIAVLILSFIYSFLFYLIKNTILLAYIQAIIDTFIVSFIIFVTGNYSSIFSFLYLLLIIYTSILLYRKGSMIIAFLCIIQYGIMIDLEYLGLITPFSTAHGFFINDYSWFHVIYKIVITSIACFAVAFLSSLLSENARKTASRLKSMEKHVKVVEKLASVGEMAAGLVHEIKNPLASLTGSIQLLKENIKQDEYSDKLMNIILREADRLTTLVSEFLLFARPPAGKAVTIDLGKTLAETIELFENDENCRNSIDIDKTFIWGIQIRMDPMHLRQIFWNILLNAAEAIENHTSNKGQIKIKMYPVYEKFAMVKIIDNGCGIASNIKNSIFDPFFTTKNEGTGLGLSIVYRILESYDSSLDIKNNTQQKGTTVVLNFKSV